MTESKSYHDRGRAAPLNHTVYEDWAAANGISDADFLDLKNRGIDAEQIRRAGYSTKHPNNSGVTQQAVGAVRSKHEIRGVPGFYTREKDGHWTCQGSSGINIPVRDINGHISSIVIRNAKPKERNGKVINKYIAFSSAGKTDGAKVWQTTHCPVIKGTPKEICGVTARITEGILKADIATALSDIYTLGMHGLKIQSDMKDLIEELEISTLHIAIDSGEDSNVDVVKAKADLINLCIDAGIDYKVEIWDDKYGKGIDDVLHAGHKDKIRIATDDEVQKMLSEANSVNPNNGEYVYVVSQERFYSKNDFTALKKSQFRDAFKLEKLEYIDQMISDGFPQVMNLTFYPGKDEIVEDQGRMCLNLWKDPAIVPVKGDVGVFTDHVEMLFPDEKQRNILLDFLAYNVQNPGKKILWALLIQGRQGIGKSYFATVMQNVLGKTNVVVPSNEALHEIYTGWMKRAQLAMFEEVMARGRMDLMNKLKPIITQPEASIREMHREEYTQPNRMNLMMFTNYDDAIIIDEDDRRYAIIKSDAELQSEEYYTKLWEWTKDSKNFAKLCYFFKNRDLSKFNPSAKAPDTDAKKQLIKISRTGIEEWISGKIEDKEWPFQGSVVSVRHLKSDKVCPKRFESLSDHKWGQALKKAGCEQYSQKIKMQNGSTVRVWLVRNIPILENLQNSEIKAQYEKWLESEDPGGNPLADSMPL